MSETNTPIDTKAIAAEAADAAAAPTAKPGSALDEIRAAYKAGLEDAKAMFAAAPAAPSAPTYRSPGPPVGAPPAEYEQNVLAWDRETVQAHVKAGTLKKSVDRWAKTLPGGAGSLPFARGDKGTRR